MSLTNLNSLLDSIEEKPLGSLVFLSLQERLSLSLWKISQPSASFLLGKLENFLGIPGALLTDGRVRRGLVLCFVFMMGFCFLCCPVFGQDEADGESVRSEEETFKDWLRERKKHEEKNSLPAARPVEPSSSSSGGKLSHGVVVIELGHPRGGNAPTNLDLPTPVSRSTVFDSSTMYDGTNKEYTSAFELVYTGWPLSGGPADAEVYQVKAEWNIDANYIEDVQVFVDSSNGYDTGNYDVNVTGNDFLDGYDETSDQTYTWTLSGSNRELNQTWWFNAYDIYDDTSNSGTPEWDEGRIDSIRLTLYYTYEAPDPDLTVVDGSISISDTTVEPGQSVTVYWTAKNAGAAGAGSTHQGVMWSTNPIISTFDDERGTEYLGIIGAGGSSPEQDGITIPSNAIRGNTYYIGVIADYYDDEEEGSAGEANNDDATPVAVTVNPPPPPGAPGTPDLSAADDTGYSSSDDITYTTTGLSMSWSVASGTVDGYYYEWNDSSPDNSTTATAVSVDAPSGHGWHIFYVQAFNSGGRGPVRGRSIYIDRNRPSVSGVDLRTSDDSGASVYDNITNDTNVRFTWSANANGGSGIHRSYWDWKPDSSANATTQAYADVSPPSNNGTYTFYVIAEAVSGLWAYYPSYSDEETVTWDTVTPAIPTNLEVSGGDPTLDTTPLLDWSSVSGTNRYHVQVENLTGIDYESGYSTASNYQVQDALPLGNVYWKVRSEDVAGNESSYSSRDSFEVISPTVNWARWEDAAGNELSGTYDEGTTVYLALEAIGFSAGQVFTVDIFEDDGIINDLVASNLPLTYHSSNKWRTSWISEWVPDGIGNPEFFFKVDTYGNASGNITIHPIPAIVVRPSQMTFSVPLSDVQDPSVIAPGSVEHRYQNPSPAKNGSKALFIELLEGFEIVFSDEQEQRFRFLAQHPTTANIQIASIDSEAFDYESLSIVLPGDPVTVARQRVELREDGDFSWVGAINGLPGSAMFVVNEGSVTGAIQTGVAYYRVRPLGEGLHAVVEFDALQLPPEHPPGFDKSKGALGATKKETGTDSPGHSVASDGATISHGLKAGVVTDDNVIRVLVAYTSATRQIVGGTQAVQDLIQASMDQTNQSYMNSNISVRVELADSMEVGYTESDWDDDLDRFVGRVDGFMDDIHSVRDEVVADLVILLINNTDYCGEVPEILADSDSAFAVVYHLCADGPSWSFAHEIGHLQGARHNPEADSNTTPFQYGHGFLNVDEGWRTIMAYDQDDCCPRVQYWSNPDVDHPTTGTAMGTATTHDNARVLDGTAEILTRFRDPSVFTVYNDGNTDLEIYEIAKQNGSAWLSLDPTPPLPSNIPPGVSLNVEISVDSDNLDEGQYTELLQIFSNDNDDNPYPVSVNLTVVGCTSNTQCDDGVFCNGTEACVSGSCSSGTPVTCNDGVSCTVDSCNEGTDSCDYVPFDALCNNGLFCDGVETCDAQIGCLAGDPVTCNDGVSCTVDSCDEGSDSCDYVPFDSLCSNGLFCDGVETCDPQTGCQLGVAPCFEQSCDESADSCVGCILDADCDDGLFCNGFETCSGGSCVLGTTPDCDDGDACTVDGCSEQADACVNTPIEPCGEDTPPTLTIIQPDGTDDITRNGFTVTWIDGDLESDASIDLLYDLDALPGGGSPIISGLSEDSSVDRYLWDGAGLADGPYYVYGVIDDHVNDPVIAYSSGPVTFDRTPPSLPVITSPSHTAGETSTETIIQNTWTGASDTWSGVAGFAYAYNSQSTWACDEIQDLAGEATGAQSDPLADGTWYLHLCAVDGAGNWSSVASGGPYVIEATTVTADHLDMFQVVNSFNGDDGTRAWPGPWRETPLDGGSPSWGHVRVITDSDVDHGVSQLRLRRDDMWVERPVDLSGAGTATWSFDYRRESLLDGHYVAAEVSSDGTSWSEVARISGPADDTAYQQLEVEIPLSSTHIRFANPAGLGMGNTNMVYFDNVEILLDLGPSMNVVVAALPNTVVAPGGPVTYVISVENTSPVGTLDLTTLDGALGAGPESSVHGLGTCSLPQALAPAATYSCELELSVAGDPGTTVIYSLTAEGTVGATPLSTSSTIPVEVIEALEANARDDFDAISYAGDNGSVPWTSNWIEAPIDGSQAAWGDIRVIEDSVVPHPNGPYQAFIRDDQLWLRRKLDLTGFSAALLDFDYRRSNLLSGQRLDIEVSIDGTTFEPLASIEGSENGTDLTYLRWTPPLDLSPYIGPSTWIQFSILEDLGMGNTNAVYLDNIEIRLQSGASISVALAAIPDTVVEPSGTVTFEVIVSNHSPSGSVTLTALTDDQIGDLDLRGTCSLPQIIHAGSTYACTYAHTASGMAGEVITHGVEAAADAAGEILSAQTSIQVMVEAPGLETLRDELNAVSFHGSEGSLTWATPWIESIADGGAPYHGHVRVEEDPLGSGPNALRIRRDGFDVKRQGNLSGFGSALLKVDSRRNNLLEGQHVDIEVSTDGEIWTTLQELTGPALDLEYQVGMFDLTPWISPTTWIRFHAPPSQGMGNANMVYFDNVEIQLTEPLAGGREDPTGPQAGNLLRNGNFDEGLGYWELISSEPLGIMPSMQEAAGRVQSGSAKIESSTGDGRYALTQCVTVESDLTYAFGGRVWADGRDASSPTVAMVVEHFADDQCRDEVAAVSGETLWSGSSSHKWRASYRGRTRPSQGIHSVRVWVVAQSESETPFTVWLDALSFKLSRHSGP